MNWTEAILFAVLLGILFQLIQTKRKERLATSKNLTKEDLDQLAMVYEKVEDSLTQREVFLTKNLKISDLADEIKQNEKIVSRAINHYSDGNFNSLINKFRIDKAEQMILSGEYDHYTIEAIGNECGFSNKVSFYNAFKSLKGMSPKEYWSLEQSKKG